MPELPELEVVREVLQRRAVGQTIAKVEIRPPGGLIVVRDLTHAGFEDHFDGGRHSARLPGGASSWSSRCKPNPNRYSWWSIPSSPGTCNWRLPPTSACRARTSSSLSPTAGNCATSIKSRWANSISSMTSESVPDYAGMGPGAVRYFAGRVSHTLETVRGRDEGCVDSQGVRCRNGQCLCRRDLVRRRDYILIGNAPN